MDPNAAASGGMEGRGAYNLHAQLPARGGALAIPLLEQAARRLALDAGDEAVVVADYGCAQGRNSFSPLRAAIEILRGRAGPQRPIMVFHEDLPINDFNSLFAVLASDPESYTRGDVGVFPCAIGRTFYEAVLPASQVHLGWSSYAAMWVRAIPTHIPQHIFVPCAKGDVRAVFDRQAAEDWRRFLSLRARELRPGGALVVAVPGCDENGQSGFEPIMDDAVSVLEEMVSAGVVTADERQRMVIGAWPRSCAELLAPFANDGVFEGLEATACEISALEDEVWSRWGADGDLAAVASRQAQFYRTVFAPSLALSLAGGPGRHADFSARLEEGLRNRRVAAAQPINSFVSMIAISKTGGH
jgi:hypothetical protein